MYQLFNNGALKQLILNVLYRAVFEIRLAKTKPKHENGIIALKL